MNFDFVCHSLANQKNRHSGNLYHMGLTGCLKLYMYELLFCFCMVLRGFHCIFIHSLKVRELLIRKFSRKSKEPFELKPRIVGVA